MYKVITIAREYGSGGRIIAQKVAEKLGLIYYDNEILDLAAMELGIDVEAIKSLSEEKSSLLSYSFPPSPLTLPLNDQIYAMQSQIIRHIYEHDICVIVNGCADYILDDCKDVLKVFIHAPLESRMERVKEEYKEEVEDLKKYVKARDKKRIDYYNYYTTNTYGHIKNYDLTINSDLGLDEAADIIVNLFKKGDTNE